MAFLVNYPPPCVLHEDEHLLVVNKPPGLNTHSPAPFAGMGLYEWLRDREPRWAGLAIIHRLDKETSGVLVFGKTQLANRSLTEQFSQHRVRKRYLLKTDREVPATELDIHTALVRVGEKYQSRPLHAGAQLAQTHFQVLERKEDKTVVIAEPLTGKTHQIRVHAASRGFPILGDALYGGTSFPRLCLHSESITFQHPTSGIEVNFSALAEFDTASRILLRAALMDSSTNAFRILHGASDGVPGIYADRLGAFFLIQSECALKETERASVEEMARWHGCRGLYQKTLTKHLRGKTSAEHSPVLWTGEAAPERFLILENGINYELSFGEGYSIGLFLDQRENRHRLLTNHIAAGFECCRPGSEVLNTFAYTCGFSVCAALAGARVTSLDLSKKYLEWGKRNFLLNDLQGTHDFIFGDTFDWLRRFARKKRWFDMILLGPPTFSQSSESGVFQAERDFGKLVCAALPVLKPDGILFCSTNAARLKPEEFLDQIKTAIQEAGRSIRQIHYVPQPPDFPISRLEPAYLKTAWLRVG